MSDREGTASRSPTPDSGERSATPASVVRSRTGSPSPRAVRSRTRSPSPEYKYRSRSRSRGHSSRRRHRSRSRSPYGHRSRRSRYSRSRSRSRSYSPRRRRDCHSRSRSPMSSRRRHLGSRDDPKTSNCIGIFGLSLFTQERDLRDVFNRYGPIDEVQVVYDHQTGRSRGFAFMYFRNREDAVEAKECAVGTEIDGRKIRVDYSITERAHTPTPGIYLGQPTFGYRGGAAGGGGYGRRSPSPYYSRRNSRYSRSRSRSYSPRRY